MKRIKAKGQKLLFMNPRLKMEVLSLVVEL